MSLQKTILLVPLVFAFAMSSACDAETVDTPTPTNRDGDDDDDPAVQGGDGCDYCLDQWDECNESCDLLCGDEITANDCNQCRDDCLFAVGQCFTRCKDQAP